MILGFTGTQVGMTIYQRAECMLFVQRYEVTTLHHGDCVGADREMHTILRGPSRRFGFIIIHPPVSNRKRAGCYGELVLKPKPYLERNHDIVDACDALLATPRTHDEELRSGTWATIRYARKCGKPICIVDPDGTCRYENWKEV